MKNVGEAKVSVPEAAADSGKKAAAPTAEESAAAGTIGDLIKEKRPASLALKKEKEKDGGGVSRPGGAFVARRARRLRLEASAVAGSIALASLFCLRSEAERPIPLAFGYPGSDVATRLVVDSWRSSRWGGTSCNAILGLEVGEGRVGRRWLARRDREQRLEHRGRGPARSPAGASSG